jgi:hypothetical protein
LITKIKFWDINILLWIFLTYSERPKFFLKNFGFPEYSQGVLWGNFNVLDYRENFAMSEFHMFEAFCKSLHMEFEACSKTLKMIFDKFKKTAKFS